MFEILTVKEVAALLKKHPKTISRWAATGQLPVHRLGRGWLFVKEEIIEAVTNTNTNVKKPEQPQPTQQPPTRDELLAYRNSSIGKMVIGTKRY